MSVAGSAGTEPLAGSTPILDREAPLPPRAAAGSGLTVVLTVWLGAALLVATGWLLDRPPILRQWVLTDVRHWLLDQWTGVGVVGLCVSALLAYYAMIAVHELGHAAVGLGVGFRLRSLRIGPLVFTPPLGASLYRGPGALVNGVAELAPVAVDKLSWRGIAMVMGGPAANFLTAMVVLLLPLPHGALSVFFISFSIANGVSDLVPFESRLGVSDGRRIWMLLQQPELGERWLALLRLGGDLADGVLPESLSAEFLAKAVAVRDASADTVKAHAIAFTSAFHRHEDRDAGQRLETAFAYSGHATPVLRRALMTEAAVYQARRRQRADLASQWLGEIPATREYAWFRSRAEAAVLEAKGDVAGAMAKLAEAEQAVLELPASRQRGTVLVLLQRWRDELRSS
jgi:hypothetical protein